MRMSNKAGDIVKINIRKSGAFVLMDEAVTEEMLEATMKEAVEKRPFSPSKTCATFS